ncbi:hypothetical protein PRK78_000844 [Emydomyces testavorans]|uniref:Uncharacterized protein n=1 Tax=Emydomyces testavorans TaxID=2070801 RepID=A0AAF0DBX5_9EURO|nr:hypothetical protein PRK78_000844 [Emydomyces testavorans]
MDSPQVVAPLDSREQPILDQLLVVRDALLLLKQDKSTYIKSQDVIPYYDRVIEQVQLLNNVRAEGVAERERNRGWRKQSLYILGNNEAPAA